MKEYLLYGLSKDESRDYMETLLLVTKDENKIKRVIEIASKQGWHSFRRAVYDGSAPNFTNTINI